MAWLGTWAKRIKLTIDNGDIDAALVNFPVLVYISASSGIGNTDLSGVFDELTLDANRKKIAVTTSDGVTQCYVEIERWDDANEKAWLWVKVPAVSNTADTVLYLYYDVSQPDNDTYVGDTNSTPAENVWDANFKMVHHMGTGATGETDSTDGNNDLTEFGTVDQIDGKVGKARDLLGTDDYFEYADADLGIGSSPFTVEHLFKADGIATQRLLYTYNPSKGIYTSLLTNGRINGVVVADATVTIESAINQYVVGTWYYFVFTRDASGNIEIFLDLVSKGTDVGAGGSIDGGGHGHIGVDFTHALDYNGKLDETRVSNVERTPAWLKATRESLWDDLITYAPEVGTFNIVRIAFTSDPFDAIPTWTDITNDCLSIHTKRGRQHELDRFEAGIAILQLDNASGNYYPDNGGSIYDPNIKIGKRVSIARVYAGTFYSLYDGFVEAWKPAWLSGGGEAPVMIVECADLIKVMSRLPINDVGGYAQELSGARIKNVLDDVLWLGTQDDIDTGRQPMQATGALTNEIAQSHILDVCLSEISLFYMAADGDAQYEDRSHRTLAPHDTSQAIFGDDAGEMSYTAVEFALDDKLLYNEIRATMVGGTEQSEEDAASKTAYGHRGLVRSGLLLISDVPTQIYCAYLLARYKDNITRVRSITILPQDDPANLWPKVLGYEISTRITVRLNQAHINAEYFIEGIEHDYEASVGLWTTKWRLSDAAHYLYSPSARNMTLRPEGDGGIQLDRNAEDANWKCVDDVIKDDDTTYVSTFETPAAQRSDRYTCEPEYDQGTINSVTIYCWVRCTEIATTKAFGMTFLFTHALGYYGTQTDLTVAWALLSKVYTDNPNTLTTWTMAEVKAMQIGVSLKPGITGGITTGEPRCTQVYAVVNYTPAW